MNDVEGRTKPNRVLQEMRGYVESGNFRVARRLLRQKADQEL